MTALAGIAEWPQLVKKLLLTHTKNSAGIFGVTFYIKGKPTVISVDDLLLYNSLDQKPYFAKLSDGGTSIWGAVVEKAFAKVLGNYLKINLGHISNGFRILTGNPVFTYDLKSNKNPGSIFNYLSSAEKLNFIMAAGTGSGDDTTLNECGLNNGHAYTILSAFTMTDNYNIKY
jgi:calpain-15